MDVHVSGCDMHVCVGVCVFMHSIYTPQSTHGMPRDAFVATSGDSLTRARARSIYIIHPHTYSYLFIYY